MQIWILIFAVCAVTEVTEGEENDLNATRTIEHREGKLEQRIKLYKYLTENYDSGVNPDNPNVHFGLSLINVDIDEDKSTLESNVWLKYIWYDSRLSWDIAEYPLTLIRMEYESIWHPDITLYNSADLSTTSTACWESNVLVYPTGKILWVPPCHFSSFCKMSLAVHPFDEQTCFLKFGSWTFDSEIMDLSFYHNETSIDMSDFWDLTEWKVIRTNAVKNVKYYECCPEPYSDLTFNLTLKRKPQADSLCTL